MPVKGQPAAGERIGQIALDASANGDVLTCGLLDDRGAADDGVLGPAQRKQDPRSLDGGHVIGKTK
jgi:hypothetical protein